MSDKTKIEWTDATWSPVTGCDPISTGCKNCYAKREVEQRWSKNPKSVFFGRAFNDVQCHESALSQPLSWKKPKKIFVCPRADLFHDDVPDSFIDRVFAVIALAPQHTFQILTKRARRMQEYMSEGGRASAVLDLVRNSELGYIANQDKLPPQSWPLSNVWLGVSIEDQAAADERIPLLLDTPAATRWISAEPLLGPVSLRWLAAFPENSPNTATNPSGRTNHLDGLRRLDWVVVGGESGPKARPMSPDWARGLRKQCADSGVPFYFKQWGEWIPMLGQRDGVPVKQKIETTDGWIMGWAGTKATGRMLDGVLHDDYPEVR